MIASVAYGCLAFAITTSAAHCQQPGVSLRIDFVAWGNDINGLSLKTTNKAGAISALGFRYSTPVTYSGPALMEIHQTAGSNPLEDSNPEISEEDRMQEKRPLIPETVAEGVDPALPKSKLAAEIEKRREASPTLVALCPLPQGSSCVTALLMPAAAGIFQCYVINDDPSTLPLGQIRVHNLTSLHLALRCDGIGPKTLKPRETFVTPTKNRRLIYELAYQQDKKWIVQESNIISAPEDEQIQMIVLKSEHSYFRSSDGSTGGFLQVIKLQRKPGRNGTP